MVVEEVVGEEGGVDGVDREDGMDGMDSEYAEWYRDVVVGVAREMGGWGWRGKRRRRRSV